MSLQKIYVSQEERTIKRRTIAMEVENDFIQMYKNLLDYMVNVKSLWSFKYIIFLISKMNGENQVEVGVKATREFQEYLRQRGLEPPAERTIGDAITELVEHGLLVRLSRGNYKINPAIFWQRGMQERLEHVTALVEGGHKLEATTGIVVLEDKEEETHTINGKVQDDSEGRPRALEGSEAEAGG